MIASSQPQIILEELFGFVFELGNDVEAFEVAPVLILALDIILSPKNFCFLSILVLMRRNK